MVAGAAGLAGNLGRKVSQHITKMVQKWFQNGSKMASWRPQNGSLEASGRPLASLGGLGAPKTDFERFWDPFGVPFWDPKSIKKALKNKLKSNIAFDAYFEPSGGPLGHFWGPFWRYFGVLFEVPSREAGFLKNLEKPMEKHYFLRFRGVQNRPKPGPETASGRIRAERPS